MFVTFEGPEGAGKSTVIRSVAERLRSEGREILVTREPGAGEVGKAIREILLHGGTLEPRAELLLFLADRAQHMSAIIEPALAEGHWVLCDRHADSTLVYQGMVRGLDRAFVEAGNRFATGGRVPDRTLLLDLPAEVGLARITSPDRLDREPLSFHQAVRAGFLELAHQDPVRWRIIDATQTPEAVAGHAYGRLMQA